MELNKDDSILFMKFIYELNQEFKNQSTGIYSIVNGNIYIHDFERAVYIKAQLQIPKRFLPLKDQLTNLCCNIDGGSLFKWYQEYKKGICKVILHENHFEIHTELQMVFVTGAMCTESKSTYTSTLKRIKEVETKFRSYHHISVDDFKELKKRTAPLTIDAKGIKFRLTHKYLFGHKKKFETLISVKEFNKKDKVYIMRFVFTGEFFNAVSYLAIVNY